MRIFTLLIVVTLLLFSSSVISNCVASESVLELRERVGESRYCYIRRFNLIYKDGRILTYTPLIPYIRSNEDGEQLKLAIKIVNRNCY